MAKELKLPETLSGVVFSDRCIIFDRDGKPWLIDPNASMVHSLEISARKRAKKDKRSAVVKRPR